MGYRTVFDYECDFRIIEWAWRLAARMGIGVCRRSIKGEKLGMGFGRGESE